jgi:hypothetical protein
MAVAVTLPNDLETWLKTRADQMGVPVETLLSRTIEERWGTASKSPNTPPHETELLLRLQNLFPPEETREYHDLCRKSDDGTLTPDERERFLEVLEQRDLRNAERLEIVARLSQSRGVPFREVMAQLEIRPE